LSSAAQVTNVVNSSVDAALLAEYKFSLTVAGNFNAFFSESIETGKLRRSFYDDIAALFQTTNILLTRFANGSLVADFAVRVPQSNRLANKMVGLSESVMKSSTAWLGRTQVTYATKSANTLPTPTVLRTNTGEVTNTATLMSCNKVCFQVILILAGAALLMIFIFFACCMCRGKKKTLHSEWDSKAPGHASPSQPNRV
jgi:hypothetical protein